jgi:Icc protein
MSAIEPLILQLSDPHIGARWGQADPEVTLAAVVEHAARVAPAPTCVVLSGDLADHASDAEYARLRELLEPLTAPIHVLAGNHDDRDALRKHFGLSGGDGDPLQYSVDLGTLRLLVLDTSDPGHDGGRLDDQRLHWLDAELALEPTTPTVIAMHHPPLVTALPSYDDICLPPTDTRALADVLARHSQVARIISGHLHRTLAGTLGRCGVLVAPSTYMQATLDFSSTVLTFTDSAPGFAVHAFVGGELVSHVEMLAP